MKGKIIKSFIIATLIGLVCFAIVATIIDANKERTSETVPLQSELIERKRYTVTTLAGKTPIIQTRYKTIVLFTYPDGAQEKHNFSGSTLYRETENGLDGIDFYRKNIYYAETGKFDRCSYEYTIAR